METVIPVRTEVETVIPVTEVSRGELAAKPVDLFSDQFSITLNKGSGTDVGLDVDYKDGQTLKITQIKDGLIRQWNAQHNATSQVNVGDSIIDINGTRGNSGALMATVRQSSTLTMLIQRGPGACFEDVDIQICDEEPLQFALTFTKGPNDVLGLDVDWGDGKTLKVTKVKEGLVKVWNQTKDQKLNVGDYIVDINGARGDSHALLDQVKRSNEITMTIERRHGA